MHKQYKIIWQSPDEREGRKEDTRGFYTAVLKGFESKKN
jgi:hypothetical protein